MVRLLWAITRLATLAYKQRIAQNPPRCSRCSLLTTLVLREILSAAFNQLWEIFRPCSSSAGWLSPPGVTWPLPEVASCRSSASRRSSCSVSPAKCLRGNNHLKPIAFLPPLHSHFGSTQCACVLQSAFQRRLVILCISSRDVRPSRDRRNHWGRAHSSVPGFWNAQHTQLCGDNCGLFLLQESWIWNAYFRRPRFSLEALLVEGVVVFLE